jgi:polysaccharide biosynthesis/export protein
MSAEKVPGNNMRTAIWSALLAVVPLFCASGFASQEKTPPEAKSQSEAKAPPQSQPLSPVVPAAHVAQQPKAAPSGSSEASKSSEPSKMAAPRAAASERVGGAPIDEKTYVIGAEDQIGINVWGVQALSSAYLVRPDGRITMPLIGDVRAAGLTPEQLTVSIADRLKEKYINSPDVTVLVLAVNSKKYYIHGEVNSPGSYPLIVPTTVLEALANAHGFKDFANVKKIRILRGTEQFRFNYKEVTNGKRTEQNIYLQPGDEIIVP